jgi:hypothetical protein
MDVGRDQEDYSLKPVQTKKKIRAIPHFNNLSQSWCLAPVMPA